MCPYVLYTITNIICFMNATHPRLMVKVTYCPNWKSQTECERPIMGVITSGIKALCISPSHAVHQSLEEVLWYCLPLCNEHLGKQCTVVGWDMVTPKFASQLIPRMLYGAQIWGICWPIHPVNIVLSEEIRNHSSTMRSGVVIFGNTAPHRYVAEWVRKVVK